MTLRDAIAKAARECIEEALAQHGNNVMRTAAALGVNRTYLYWCMDRYGVAGKRRRRKSVAAFQELASWGRVQ